MCVWGGKCVDTHMLIIYERVTICWYKDVFVYFTHV